MCFQCHILAYVNLYRPEIPLEHDTSMSAERSGSFCQLSKVVQLLLVFLLLLGNITHRTSLDSIRCQTGEVNKSTDNEKTTSSASVTASDTG